MNNNSTKQPSKFARFLRNNAALLLLIFCVLAITAVVLAVTLTKNKTPVPDNPVTVEPDDNQSTVTPPDDEPTEPSTQKVNVYFMSPVESSGIGLEYTFGPSNMFTFKSTLNEWSAHKALDLQAEEGAEVCAMYDGTVIDSGKSFLKGYYVTVDHGEGVIATYASMQDVQVAKGQSVKRGEVLGYVGTTAESEYKEGPHLHLEVTANGTVVDPTPYTDGTIYRTVEVAAN